MMALTSFAVAFVLLGLALGDDRECVTSTAANGHHGHCVTVESCPYAYYVSGKCPSYGYDVKCCYSCHYGGCQTESSGQIYFHSQTFSSLGIRGFVQDVLRWAVEEGQKAGIEVWAWFEYGLMASWSSSPTVPAFSTAAYNRGWMKGEANGYWWMDAGNTEVLDFLAGMMQDALDNYPGLAGVQLDDHFAQPSQLGTDLVLTMTNAARRILGQVSGRVSFSPIVPTSLSVNGYNVDWVSWVKEDIGFHEYVPQIYRDNAPAFNLELDRVMLEVGKTKLVIGLRCNGSGAPTAYSELSQMLGRCETEGVGYSIWYSQCFTQLYTDLMLG
ncbi:uncharacterized protein LOC118415119 isoform X3 [Branchiostoma floridae]|uniref:Uncharacterized protein LOC118415119 isoform X3 n=1 Tax=Branchiostoma floridae TaxID=7739 RepID=A0A9J7MP63_BRAFL|nr:uncharacterized protein LOC118415119 isoform X3 [Branchiostoma floridae]